MPQNSNGQVNMKRTIIAALVCGASLGTIGTAQAQTKADPSLELVVASRGISKGLAQTKGPQFLARGELAFGSLYVGSYAKNVTSSSAEGEAAALVGVRTKAAGFDLNVSAAMKRAIDPAPGSDKTALEVAGSASRKLGRLTPKLSAVWSPDDVGSTRRTLFVEGGASYAIAKPLSFSAAIGRRERSGGADYTAWNAGFAWTASKNLVLDARYYDTNGGDTQPYRARGVVSARLKF
ncbi:MAG TPA: TorF family putative porin [Sphingomicrobium sp.]